MTKSDDKRVPALRFKGFTDEWEQRKLKNLVDFYSGLTYHPENIREKGTFVIRSSNIKDGQLVTGDNIFVAPEIVNSTYVKKDDIIVVVRNGSRKLIGKHTKLNFNLNNAVIGAFMTGIRSNNNNFINAIFDSDNFKREIHKNLGATINQITTGELKRMNFYIPSLTSEQNYLGNLMKVLDKLITLQQRKLTELQLLRTSLNQQLLKDNSSWKSVKLREILNIRNKQIFPNQQYPLMSFVQKQGVVPKSQRYNRDFLVKGNKKYKVTEKGDFIYSSNNLETGSIGINKTGNATISPVYSVFSSKNYKESLFIGLLSEKKSFIYKMIRFRQGVVYGQWKIPEKDFLNIKIKIPNYQEQEKIITLFTHIDNQFKQENKKLTDLQNFKQFLLQNMFI